MWIITLIYIRVQSAILQSGNASNLANSAMCVYFGSRKTMNLYQCFFGLLHSIKAVTKVKSRLFAFTEL